MHVASKDSPSPKVAYDDVQSFSDIMEAKRKSVCSVQTMQTFPEDPKVFMDAYPDAFCREDPPIESRVSLSAIVERCRKEVTPCRNTNQHVRGHFTTPSTVESAPAATAPESVNGVLLSLLEKFMFQRGHAPLVVEHSHHAPLGSSPLGSPREPSLGKSRPSSVENGSSPAPLFSGGWGGGCTRMFGPMPWQTRPA